MDFCGIHGHAPLPAVPQTFALYLKSLERRSGRDGGGVAVKTLRRQRRRLSAIASRHTTAHHDTPTDHSLVRRLVARYVRSRGAAKQEEGFPLLLERVPALLSAGDARRSGGALRPGVPAARLRRGVPALRTRRPGRPRSKIFEEGVYVWIAAAKNDPRKAGRELHVPRLPRPKICPVLVLERWLEVVRAAGAVFRTFDLRGQSAAKRLHSGDVARILPRRAAAAGISGNFAGHSLRRGFITDAAKMNVPIERIKGVMGQHSNAIALDYVAAATIDEDPPLLNIADAVLKSERYRQATSASAAETTLIGSEA